MKETMKWIGSGTTHYEIGLFMGIAITIISLLGSAKYPWFQAQFDWMLVLFVGLGIFFFFMGIRLNTEENTNIDINDTNRKTFVSHQTFLDRFNILSRASFGISITFAILSGFRLLALMVISV